MAIRKLLGHKTLFALVSLAMLIITWASLAKIASPVPIRVQGSDKIGHFIAYFGLTLIWFLFFFFSEKQNRNFTQSILISSIICILYGGLMEILQALITNYRSSDWYDMIANTSGTVFVVIICSLFKNKLIAFRKISN